MELGVIIVLILIWYIVGKKWTEWRHPEDAWWVEKKDKDEA
jgi:hypothetical protein